MSCRVLLTCDDESRRRGGYGRVVSHARAVGVAMVPRCGEGAEHANRDL